MKFSSSFFNSVFLAVVFASAASAVPTAHDNSPIARATLSRRDDLGVVSFFPEVKYETFGTEGIDHPLTKRGAFRLKEAAESFVASRLGAQGDSFELTSELSHDAAKHSYFKQKINGVPVANAVANVAFNKANKVVSFGSSFVKPASVPSTVPTVTLEAAIATAEKQLSGKYNQHPASLEFVARPDGSVALTHVVQVQNDEAGTAFEAFVDAHSGELIQITNFVAHAAYRVVSIEKQSVAEGTSLLTDPADLVASPNGWHTVGSTTSTDTSGNNAVAYKGAESATTPQSAANQTFDYAFDPALGPTAPVNLDAARTNAFYIVNTIHDILYRYGFTEAGFNFQNDNFGKGGAGNDRVLISVQDGAGTNNAFFSTFPDGQPGLMQMFIFTITNPNRDGSLDNDIIAHEATHGTTNRMTGGGTARCLQTPEAGGMGEGWSDAFAEWTEQKDGTIRDYVTGTYVLDNTAGVRNFPYSTDPAVNPLRYSSLRTTFEVHDVGEIWANMLHNVYAALVAAHGWDANAKTNPDSTAGNAVYLHLFLDALALQPCEPTFLTARDAWLQADANRYGGANKCLLWKQFASRGLGTDAANHRDGSAVPEDCN